MPKKYIFEAEQTNDYVAHVRRIQLIKSKSSARPSPNALYDIQQKHHIHQNVRNFNKNYAFRSINCENNRLAKTLTFMKSTQQSKYNDSHIISKYSARKRDWDIKLNLQNYHIGKKIMEAVSSVDRKDLQTQWKQKKTIKKNLLHTTQRQQFVKRKENQLKILQELPRRKLRIGFRAYKFLSLNLVGLYLDKSKLLISQENLYSLVRVDCQDSSSPFITLEELLKIEFVFAISKNQFKTMNKFSFSIINDRHGQLVQICRFQLPFIQAIAQNCTTNAFKGAHRVGLVIAKTVLKGLKKRQKQGMQEEEVNRLVRRIRTQNTLRRKTAPLLDQQQ